MDVSAEWPHTLPKNPAFPPVTLVTPTYNRRKFIPWLFECIKAQTYPLERMEWLVFDDGEDKIADILEPLRSSLPQIRYFSSDTKLTIGQKRNRLNVEARGAIIVVMDDDDYYPPERVAHAVSTLLGKKHQICGSTRNQLYFTDDASIWEVGPYNANHATFGTMAYTKEYALSHSCDETVTHAEEIQFTNKYSEPLYQLDPKKVMLVMCHSANTYNKHKLREEPNEVFRKTALKLRAFIRVAKMRAFYATA